MVDNNNKNEKNIKLNNATRFAGTWSSPKQHLFDVLVSAYNYCGPNYTAGQYTWSDSKTILPNDVLAKNYIDAICQEHDSQYTLADNANNDLDRAKIILRADAKMLAQIEIFRETKFKVQKSDIENPSAFVDFVLGEKGYSYLAEAAFKIKHTYESLVHANAAKQELFYGSIQSDAGDKYISQYLDKYSSGESGIHSLLNRTESAKSLSLSSIFLNVSLAEAARYDDFETYRASALSDLNSSTGATKPTQHGSVLDGATITPASQTTTSGQSAQQPQLKSGKFTGSDGKTYIIENVQSNGQVAFGIRSANGDQIAIEAVVSADRYNDLLTALVNCDISVAELADAVGTKKPETNTATIIQTPTTGQVAGTVIGSLSSFLNIPDPNVSIIVNKAFDAAGTIATSIIDNGSATFRPTFQDGSTGVTSLEAAGGQFIGGIAASYIMQNLGITGLPGQMMGSLLNTVTTTVATAVIAGKDVVQALTTALDPSALAGNFAGILGSFLANKILPINSPAGSVVSAVASLYISTALTPILGPFAFLLGGFGGGLLGGVVSKIFGGGKFKAPEAVTDTGLDADGRFAVLGSGSRNGGKVEITQQMAHAAVDTLNAFLDMVGGTIANTEDMTGLRYGYKADKKGTMTFFVGPDDDVHANSFKTMDEALDFGVLKEIRSTQIEGGNLFLKRGLYGSDATTRAEMGADLTTAGRYAYYRAYKDAAPAALLQMARQQNFSWDEVLKEAEALALDVPHPADHYSRVNYLAGRAAGYSAQQIIAGTAQGKDAPKVDFAYKLTGEERYNQALYEQLVKEGRIEVEKKEEVKKVDPNSVTLPELKDGDIFVDTTWRELAASILDMVNAPTTKPAATGKTHKAVELGHEGDDEDAIVTFRDPKLKTLQFWKTAAENPTSAEARTALMAGAVAGIALTRSPSANAQATDIFDPARGIEVAGGTLFQNRDTGKMVVMGRALADIDVGSRHDWTQTQHTVLATEVVSTPNAAKQAQQLVLPTAQMQVLNGGPAVIADATPRQTVLFSEPVAAVPRFVPEQVPLPTVQGLGAQPVSVFTTRGTSVTLDAASMSGGGSILGVGDTSGGRVTLTSDGRLIFTPTVGFSGTGSVDLLVVNSTGEVSTTTATVTVLNTGGGTTATTATTATTTGTSSVLTTATLTTATLTTVSTTQTTSATETGSGTGTGTTTVVTTTESTGTGTSTVATTSTTTGTTSSGTTGTGSGGGYSASLDGAATVAPPVVPPAPGPVVPPPGPGVTISLAAIVQTALGGDAGTLKISGITGTSVGTAQVAADGSLRLIPPANYTGSVTITVTIDDGAGGTLEVPLTLDGVTGAILPPDTPAPSVAAEATATGLDDLGGGDDGAVGTEDIVLVFRPDDLTANDPVAAPADPLADPLPPPVIAAVHSATNGTVNLAADGSIRFQPTANAHGAASFQYETEDVDGVRTTHTVTLDLAPVNDAPTVSTPALVTAEDTGLTLSAATLAGRFADVDGDTVTVTAVETVLGGQVALSGAGDLTFTPNANFNGTAAFRITVSDGQGASVTRLQTVAVSSVNDAPVAGDQTGATDEDRSVLFGRADLLADASDIDGDRLTVSAVSGAVGGTAQVQADGSVRFTPDANFNGAAGFDYTISDGHGGTVTARMAVDVAAVNDAPTGGAILTTQEDTPLTLDFDAIRAGDQDVEGDAITFEGITAIRHGILAENGDGTLTFTPDADFHGVAGFDYRLTDVHGAEGTATVRIDVASVNDAPTAQDHSRAINEDSPLALTRAEMLAGAHDVDGDTLAVAALTGVTGGSAQITASGGVLFTPDANYFGAAGFDYTVSDGNGGTVTSHVAVDIASVNDAPIGGATLATDEDTPLKLDFAAVRGNESDVEGDVISFDGITAVRNGTLADNGDGTLTFTPDANFYGTAGFDYALSDDQGGHGTATVVINVASVNDAPVAADHTTTITEDQGILVPQAALLTGAQDVENDPLRVTAVTGATGGTVSLDASGNVIFLPDADYFGDAGFSYTVTDSHGDSGSAYVGITITPVNDAPRSGTDAAAFDEDTSYTFDPFALMANDYDVEGDAFTFVGSLTPHHGTLTTDENGLITFTPDADYFGTAGFSYQVTDAEGATATLGVTLTVNAINDAPVAAADAFTFAEDNVALFSRAVLTANDVDVDGDLLTITQVTDAVGGTVVLTAGGDVRFTPHADYNGPGGFSYTVSDGHGESSTASVTLDITPVNDAPRANTMIYAGTEEVPLLIDPTQILADASAYDVDGDGFSFTGFTGAGGGTLDDLGDGTFVFTPNDNFFGPAVLTYTMTDEHGAVATGHTILDIANVQDIPVAAPDHFTIQEDQNAVFSGAALTGNDIDMDGDALTVVAVSNVQGGTAYASGGQVYFNPHADYNGAGGFDYLVSDGHGGSDSAHVSIAILPVNDAPRVTPDFLSPLYEDQPGVIATSALVGNDYDPEGDFLSVTSVWGAVGGSASLGGGAIYFTPNADYFGTAGFSYQVADGQGGYTTSSASFQILNINDMPTAQNETITAQEDQILNISQSLLTQNDRDPDNDPLSIDQVGNATHGQVALNGGTITFTPDHDYSGTASFDYRITDGQGGYDIATATVNIAPVNDLPVVLGEVFNGYEDTELLIPYSQLLANDYDPEGDTLTISGVQGATADGAAVHFQMGLNQSGTGGFTYTVSDGKGGFVNSYAAVTVQPVNDAPVSIDANVTGVSGNIITGAISGWDADGDHLSFYFDDWATVQRYVQPQQFSFNSGNGAFSLNTVFQGHVEQTPEYFIGTMSLSVRIVDPFGAATTGHINITATPPAYVPPESGGGGNNPVVLDLDGNGIELLSLSTSTVRADFNGSGLAQATGWIGAGDAFLALDDDGDGIIKAADIVFTDDHPDATTDMEGVQLAYDSNKNGALDVDDARYGDFRVWQDANSDGVADTEEVQTLTQAGIASIGLTAEKNPQTVNGNTVYRMTEFARTDGTTGAAADVSLAAGAAQPVSVTTIVPQAVVSSGAASGVPVATTQTAATVASAGAVTTSLPSVVVAAPVTAVDAASAGGVASTEAAFTAVPTSVTTTQAAAIVLPTSAGAEASATATGTVTQTTPEGTVATTTPSTETGVSANPAVETASVTESATVVVPETTATNTSVASESGPGGVTSTAEATVEAPAAPAALTETSAPASTAAVDLAASIANQADLLRQAMAAFDPAPSVAAAASATDLLTPAATLAANPISAGDQGDGKLAA